MILIFWEKEEPSMIGATGTEKIRNGVRRRTFLSGDLFLTKERTVGSSIL